jgi:hypothetical protein
MSIEVNKVCNDKRGKIIAYQKNCDRILKEAYYQQQTGKRPNATKSLEESEELITLHKSVLKNTGSAIVTINEDGNTSAKPIEPKAEFYITTIIDGQAPQMTALTGENLKRLVDDHMPEYTLLNTKQFAEDIRPIVQANHQAVNIWTKLGANIENKLLKLGGK